MKLWSVAHFHPHFWVGLLLHPPANPPKSEDGNGQLTRVAFKINDFLWNPYFNNIRTVQSESSKFASLLFDQILNRRVVGTDRHAICWYFASIRLCLALLFIISIVEVFRTILNLSCKVFYSHEISFLNLQTFRELMLYLFFTKRFTIDLINFEAFDALRQTIFRST